MMGRPRKDTTVEEAVTLTPKKEKEPVVVPSVGDLVATIDLSDLDMGPTVEDIKMGTRPAIVTEAHLKEAKSATDPANPTIPLVNQVAKVSSTDLELIKSYFTDVKGLLLNQAQAPPDLTMFKAWQDMANKKFVEISTTLAGFETKLDRLDKSYQATRDQSVLLEGAVNSLRSTVLDFLDALNQKKVLVSAETITMTKPPLNQEDEEDEVEEPPFVPNNPNYPAAALGNPQALFDASEKLPPKIRETIKASVNRGTPKLWSQTFSPNISKKFPQVTENDVFAWLVSLNALDAEGKIDPTKL